MHSLDLGHTYINDDAFNSLEYSLTDNNRLKKLDLIHNRSISATVWEAFSVILRNLKCNLARIDFDSLLGKSKALRIVFKEFLFVVGKDLVPWWLK